MTKPIRVLYDIHPHILGGTERFLARFLKRLDPRKYEPLVISQKEGKPLQLIRSMGIETQIMPDYFRTTGIQRLAAYLQRERIDLAQSNYYSSCLAMASNLVKIPHVWRLGGHLDFCSHVRSERDDQSALRMIRMLSTWIVCNSNYVKRQFRGVSDSPPIKVIQNGISIPRRVNKKTRGTFSVAMVAHFTPQKRHIDFIQAAEIVSRRQDNVSFSIFGDAYADSPNRSYAEEVRRRARNLQIKGKLKISEFVSSNGNGPNKLDILVLPSVGESFSNAILEAMAAGIPVIAARSGGNSELVQHRSTGLLISPMQPKALARAILLLTRNSELMSQMGQAGRERAKEHFSIDQCVKRYEAVYSNVTFNGIANLTL